MEPRKDVDSDLVLQAAGAGLAWSRRFVVRFILIPFLFLVLLVAAFLAWRMYSISHAGPSRSSVCKSNLAWLATGFELYGSKYGTAPVRLRDLYQYGIVNDPNFFICPFDGKQGEKLAPGTPWESFADRVNYEYRADRIRPNVDGNPPHVAIVWDRAGHGEDGGFVLYQDGKVEYFAPEGFRQAIRDPDGEKGGPPAKGR